MGSHIVVTVYHAIVGVICLNQQISQPYGFWKSNFVLNYDVASGYEITPCNKIDLREMLWHP